MQDHGHNFIGGRNKLSITMGHAKSQTEAVSISMHKGIKLLFLNLSLLVDF